MAVIEEHGNRLSCFERDGVVLLPFEPEQLSPTELSVPQELSQLDLRRMSLVSQLDKNCANKEEVELMDGSPDTGIESAVKDSCLENDSKNSFQCLIEPFKPDDVAYFLFIPESSVKHPRNQSRKYKSSVVLLYALTSLGTQVCTSMFGQAVPLIREQYGISPELAMLPTSIFLVGLSFGPLIFAPFSEKYGRKKSILIPYLLASLITLFTYPVQNFAVLIVLRFLSGLLASAPIISSGGALKDMFSPSRRADVLLMYAILVASGPAFGPVLGGSITQWLEDYRFIFLFVGSYMVTTSIISLFVISETYIPLVEDMECEKLGKEFPHVSFYCLHSCQGKRLPIEKYLKRPYTLLLTHMTGWLSLYACFAFGTLYMVVANLPGIVRDLYDWPQGLASAFNLTQFIGILLGAVINAICNRSYRIHIEQVKVKGVTWKPEKRFFGMALGAVLMPIGFALLRIGSETHWVITALSQVLIGCGFFCIFQASLNYVIDVHGDASASAVSGITMLRSLAAAALPMLAISLIKCIGLATFCYIMIGTSAVASLLPFYMWRNWHKMRRSNIYALKYPQ